MRRKIVLQLGKKLAPSHDAPWPIVTVHGVGGDATRERTSSAGSDDPDRAGTEGGMKRKDPMGTSGPVGRTLMEAGRLQTLQSFTAARREARASRLGRNS